MNIIDKWLNENINGQNINEGPLWNAFMYTVKEREYIYNCLRKCSKLTKDKGKCQRKCIKPPKGHGEKKYNHPYIA